MAGTWKTLWFLLDAGQRRLLMLLALSNLLAGLLEVLSLGSLIPFMALLVEPDERLSALPFVAELIPSPDSRFLLLGAGLAAVFIFTLKNLLALLLEGARARFAHRNRRLVAERLFQRYLESPWPPAPGRSSTLLLHRMHTLPDVFHVTTLQVLQLAYTLLVLLGLSLFLCWLDARVFFSLFAVLGIAGLLFLRISRRTLEALGRELHDSGAELDLTVQQGLRGLKELRLLGRTGYLGERFRTQALEAEVRDARYQLLAALPRYLLETLTVLLVVAALFLLQARGETPQILIIKLTVFGVAAFRILPALLSLIQALAHCRFGQAELEILSGELQNEAPILRDPVPAALPVSFSHELRLEEISYTYPGAAAPVLSGISLRLAAGESLGICGPSGAGKTTLVELICGLIPPDSGRILCDGLPLHPDMSRWQARIGYVPQRPFLADVSILRNIGFGLPEGEIDRKRVEDLLDQVCLGERVRALPRGLDTPVGEDGVHICGGEMQRLALARALYTRPRLLILDEASDALDLETEAKIFAILDEEETPPARIIISQRPETLRYCARVLRLEGGRIVSRSKVSSDARSEFERNE